MEAVAVVIGCRLSRDLPQVLGLQDADQQLLQTEICINILGEIKAAADANQLINQLCHICMHGPLMFHQSGGRCDGSQPMCFAEGELRTGSSDVCLGAIDGCRFYMSKDQFEYWQHTQLILDITSGRGSSFSLEIPLGVRFYIHSRIFSDQELEELAELIPE